MLDAIGQRLAEVGLQDGLDWADVVAFSAGALTVITFLGLFLRPLYREMRDFLSWWRKFQVDWDGEPARPGHDASPGVMARLNRIDGEFNRNGGSTMKDGLYRTERAIENVGKDVKRARRDIVAVQRRQAANLAVGQQNLQAIGDAMVAGGHEAPRFVEFPPIPAIIDPDDPEEV